MYKVSDALRAQRPDLVALEIATGRPARWLCCSTDPANRVLAAAYDPLVPELVAPDPQVVPEPILTRRRAMKGDDLLSSPGLARDIWRAAHPTQPGPEAGPAVSEAYRRAGLVAMQGV